MDFNVSVDTSQVSVDFASCKSILLHQPCLFNVNVNDPHVNAVNAAHQREVKAIITSPSGGHLVPKVYQSDSVTWKVEYVASEIGEYYVDVFYANQLVAGSPFKSNVFDPSRIRIVPNLYGLVDHVVKFEVDASKAGTGQLEIAVDNGKIPCNFTSQGNLKFIPSFTPRDSGKHEISIKFNNLEVPESPFYCHVVDINRITLVSRESHLLATSALLFPIYKTNFIDVSLEDLFLHNLNVKLITPSGFEIPISRSSSTQSMIQLEFVANEVGKSNIVLLYPKTEQKMRGSNNNFVFLFLPRKQKKKF